MIPEQVIIGGHVVEIKVIDQNMVYKSNSGLTLLWKNQIQLAESCHETIQEQTLCHELLHEMLNKSGAYRILKDESDSKEEDLCMMLENIFWRLLKDNTNFFDDKEKLNKAMNNLIINVGTLINNIDETIINKNPLTFSAENTSDHLSSILERLMDISSIANKEIK
jgi:hypothetical protein